MSTTSSSFRWAVLGPGSIARRFASQLPDSQDGVLVAVGSSSPERAAAFAEEFPLSGPALLGSYDEVLGSDEVDAVYISTVHTAHARLAAAALEAGKHVLCEKPLTPNAGTTMALTDLAQRSGKVLLEAYMYRFHPQTVRVLELVGEGAIGEVTHVDASFAFDTGGRSGRLFDTATAGGGILDVGCYPMSFARFVAGAAQGSTCADPIEVRGSGTLGATGVDEWATAEVTLPGGITASLRTGVRLADPQSATITGTRGVIRLADPWGLGPEQVIELDVVGEERRRLEIPAASAYALEADALALAAREGGVVPELTGENSLGQARALDQWREQIGLRYPFEADDADIPTLTGEPLAAGSVQLGPAMAYGTLPGLDKKVSRLVMGCDNQMNLAHASAIFDAFYEIGGTTFDTAYIYGGGYVEKLFGTWVQNRGVREDVVVITKGAHTPHCDPESITRQLEESLERQGTEYADLYMMHRDNPDVPVGEFVDVMDEHLRAGRISAYGGSNWTPARVDEANEYARANGRTGFTILSNHFGLAEALDVPWAGCVHATDPDSKAWLEERGLALLPWSSQARGFFTGRAHPEDRSDAELVRCYYSDENFERLARARALGEEHGVPATAIALAFVLHQKFPTFPLFGPRSIAEMRSSTLGLGVTLTESDLAWLDLKAETR
ncbi:aldo/keto reductase [Brachybacterium sacelli]|uniref:Aryl-alcohol dehydrogenase-like predicted oxidoreductase/predicted dehydrogenase n=1 Tax=Brachybacterium sacelli TaxID=173364 RepID=A0ABS4X5W3_9MICO|nr:aldo/keto reductase [Brachybacterium sacelli]MBP2383855.1 aryl-alcohol dehydrogenase-like predicted oxidoreductase/predicted dehydrogenase [Brachybacterium sacelli]